MINPGWAVRAKYSGSGLIWRAIGAVSFAVTAFGLTSTPAFAAATCSIATDPSPPTITEGGSVTFTGSVSGKPSATYSWAFEGGSPSNSSAQSVTVTYNDRTQCDPDGQCTATLNGTNGRNESCTASVTVTVDQNGGGGNQPPVLDPIGTKSVTEGDNLIFNVTTQPDPDGPSALTLAVSNNPSGSTFTDNGDGTGTFTWLNASPAGTYTGVTFTVSDGQDTDSETITITVNEAGPVPPPPDISLDVPQTNFKIMMNYELGMHCTGFEFAYCCVLPVYNSILAQVVKPETASGLIAPRLLDAHPTANTDLLDRQTVLRDVELDSNGDFKKYVLKYWHDAQPRNNFINQELVGKRQDSTLISAVENNSLMAWNTAVDAGMNPDGTLNYGDYNGVYSALKGDGLPGPNDNYQNAVWNHLYIFADPEHAPPAGVNLEGHPDSNWLSPAAENTKFRLGVNLPAYPENCGPAYHPMGPDVEDDPQSPNPGNNKCTVPYDLDGDGVAPDDLSKGSLLTYSGERGTIVFTQMKLVENLPIMLTSPRIWEALGLPLTPFEDTIDFFADPGMVDEDSIRPYVAMKARLYEYDAGAPGGVGPAVFDSNGPVTGFGTAPIDIPNCERCHAAPPATCNDPTDTFNYTDGCASGVAEWHDNSPSYNVTTVNGDRYDDSTAEELWAFTQLEYEYWTNLFPSMLSKSDWYGRLKSAAINMLKLHDLEHGTSFTLKYPGAEVAGELPQNTRLGHESIICQKCHADNVIAVVKSACISGPCGPLPGDQIKPVTEAIHWNHRNIDEGGTIAQHDLFGRSGGCQGCHPAHRSDGDMDGYPITKTGDNFYANSDNRTASGGCFVGRDVHSNPFKDSDGAETPEHLNAVGQWLADNVFRDQAKFGVTAPDGSNPDTRGIWCTNCHTQLSQELWKRDDCQDLVNGVCTDFDGNPVTNLREASLTEIANAVAGGDMDLLKSWLDPKSNGLSADGEDRTHEIWDSSTEDALVAVIEVDPAQNGAAGVQIPDDVIFQPGHDDTHPKVNILSFCTTDTCLGDINDGDRVWNYKALDLVQNDDRTVIGAAVPFGAATDGRDHWLSPGEPHCADCHAAPYVEQSGDHNPFPPFNYPRKASLMRYSRGHQDISCQGCHESIHGLYPVTPTIDTTTYAQAASLNADGSHGPLKCGTCHQTRSNGTPLWAKGLQYEGTSISRNFDAAVSWMHTYTEEADPREDVCVNCHGAKEWAQTIVPSNKKWVEHTYRGRVSRGAMSKAEIETWGHVLGDPEVDGGSIANTLDTLCNTCHTDGRQGSGTPAVSCGTSWKNHLIQGRADEKVWRLVSQASPNTGNTTCGWED